MRHEAKALEHSVFTEADTLADLRDVVRDSVKCHFEDEERPKNIFRISHGDHLAKTRQARGEN